ncbi:fatty acid amide hydrolase-like [Dorcoceras hygrometricum]|uniref:Fatty acid amide hydrolase-like n=1 Tax=Dorcoceras hygrometricum TaxID=472368 RepID=A0A2Z7A4Y7_9LAMI|nr:fatty acid amide hydrolase-like [Dorcoceras hygrometricum]
MSRLVPAARICCVVREIQSLVLGDQLLTDRMTVDWFVGGSVISILFTVSFFDNSRRFRLLFDTFEIALDSSREALPFHTTFGGCGWLVEEREVAADRVFCSAGNLDFTAGRGFNPAGGAPGGG